LSPRVITSAGLTAVGRSLPGAVQSWVAHNPPHSLVDLAGDLPDLVEQLLPGNAKAYFIVGKRGARLCLRRGAPFPGACSASALRHYLTPSQPGPA
jgi:hypothetical protein